MALVPDGPVADNRELYMGGWLFERTVMPSRVLLQCDEPITACPEMLGGVVVPWQYQLFAESEDWFTLWRGTTGSCDITFGYQSWVPPETGRWGCFLLSFFTPTYCEWHNEFGPTGPVPWPAFEVAPFINISAPVKVRWLSEWVKVSEMFPHATLLNIID